MFFRTRLLIVLLAVAVLPMTVIGVLSFYSARQSLRENKIASLSSIADLKADKINTYLKERVADIEVARKRSVVVRNMSILEQSSSSSGPEYQTARAELDANLGQIRSTHDYYDIMLADETGKIIYLCNHSRTFLKENMPLSALDAAAFGQGQDKIYFSDIYKSRERDQGFRMLLCAPVHDESGAFLGEIIFNLNMDPIYKFISDRTGLGNTGETLIGKNVGDGKIMFLNPLRHDPNAALTRSVVLGGSTALPIQQAATGKRGEGLSTDYRGEKVIAAWRPIPSMNWGMVAEIDADEAFAPVTDLARQTILFGLAILLLGVLLARVLAGSLSRPIRALKQGAAVIGGGNLDHKVGTAARDEIGDLSREFDRMTQNLKAVMASRDDLNREVEERKRAEKGLLILSSRNKSILASVPDIIMEVDKNKVYTWANPAGREFFGDDVIGREAADYFEGEQDTYPKVQPLFNGDENTIYVESWQRRKDGEKRILAWWCRVLKDSQGQVTGALSTARDITEQKKHEETLRRLNRALRTISECNQALVRATEEKQLLNEVCGILVREGGYRGVWVGLAGNGKEGAIRPAAQAGVSEEFLENIKNAITAPERSSFPILRALHTGKVHFDRDLANSPDCGECRELAKKNGYASLAVLPLNAAGNTLGVLSLYTAERDEFDDEEVKLLSELADDLAYGITALRAQAERKSLAEQLLQSQKMEAIGRLAGGIAHDFNNILTIILGLSEFMVKGFGESDPRKKDAKEIVRAAERAAGLTRQLLAFSRKQVFSPRVVDLNQTVADMDKMLRRLIGEDISLVTALDPDLEPVMADPGQIEQVIMNLAVNARDAMPAGGKLTIETRNATLDERYAEDHFEVEPGHYVMIAVSDTGHGMDDDTRKRIFEPFFTTKEMGKGTGLGLSTTYGIVKQSGGHIRVYSEPGKGSVFKVYLPRHEGEAESAVIEKLAPKSLRGTETVLLVEDEPDLRKLVRRFLTPRGYQILEASSGEEALEKCRDHPGPIHLLLTDVVLSGMNGRELADNLVQSRPGLRVLYMSGYTDNHIVHHGILAPGTFFIQKPFTELELAHKVREVMEA
jgi:PAS domain S-box-containing protein